MSCCGIAGNLIRPSNKATTSQAIDAIRACNNDDFSNTDFTEVECDGLWVCQSDSPFPSSAPPDVTFTSLAFPSLPPPLIRDSHVHLEAFCSSQMSDNALASMRVKVLQTICNRMVLKSERQLSFTHSIVCFSRHSLIASDGNLELIDATLHFRKVAEDVLQTLIDCNVPLVVTEAKVGVPLCSLCRSFMPRLPHVSYSVVLGGVCQGSITRACPSVANRSPFAFFILCSASSFLFCLVSFFFQELQQRLVLMEYPWSFQEMIRQLSEAQANVEMLTLAIQDTTSRLNEQQSRYKQDSEKLQKEIDALKAEQREMDTRMKEEVARLFKKKQDEIGVRVQQMVDRLMEEEQSEMRKQLKQMLDNVWAEDFKRIDLLIDRVKQAGLKAEQQRKRNEELQCSILEKMKKKRQDRLDRTLEKEVEERERIMSKESMTRQHRWCVTM